MDIDSSHTHDLRPDEPWLSAAFDKLDVRILAARHIDLTPGGWDWSPLPSDFWRLYQHDRPGATATWDGRTVSFDPLAVYIIPPGLKILTRNEDYIRQLYLHFDIRDVTAVILRELFPGLVRAPDCSYLRDAAASAAARLGVGSACGVSTQCLVKGLVFQALGVYLEGVDPAIVERCWRQTVAMRDIEPALACIQSRLSDPIRVDELAELCGLSESYFIQRFRSMVGVTPVAYIQNRRIAAAATLLLTTDLSIENIADLTGFNDRFYLTRIFTREIGTPPAAYRNSRHRQTAPRPDPAD